MLLSTVNWFTRAIRPPESTPNDNTPEESVPGTVGPQLAAGDPDGIQLDVGVSGASYLPPSAIIPSTWAGWPASWWPPNWNGTSPQSLSETAWLCIDLNASQLATMPPYLVDAPPSLNAEWLRNPDPDKYTSWEEFAKQVFWDYQAVGEVFVIATSFYSTGYPARFHVVPSWSVKVEIAEGRRTYRIGELDVTGDILHIRYQSSTGDAHGHGPLEVGGARMTASAVLQRYASQAGDLIPSSILEAPDAMPADQAERLRDQWIAQRQAMPGMPAVLSGGLKWTPTQLDPASMGLVELSRFNESRIAVLLGVPPYMVGLQQGDPMTYTNASALFDHHWRAGLRPKAQSVMGALSQWLLPRLTRVELNRDEYVRPGPKERAETYAILNGIREDPLAGPAALSVDEIREAERLNNTTPQDLQVGVLG